MFLFDKLNTTGDISDIEISVPTESPCAASVVYVIVVPDATAFIILTTLSSSGS